MNRSARKNVIGMFMACSALGIGGHSATAQTTSIEDMVMYAVDQPTSRLIRYEFGAGVRESVGEIRLKDGTRLDNIENLAYVPGRMYLYGVRSSTSSYRSRLYKIDMLTAEATPLPYDVGYGNVEGLTVVNELERGVGDSPTSIILQDTAGNDAFEITFVSMSYNDDGTSTWNYHVTEIGGSDTSDLSHWSLALADSHRIMPGTTSRYIYDSDGTTGSPAIKWEFRTGFTEGDFTIVLDQHYSGTYDGTGVAVEAKGGSASDFGRIFGPRGTVPPKHSIYATHAQDYYTMNLLSINPETGAGQVEMRVDRQFEGLAADKAGRLFAINGDDLWRLLPYRDRARHIGTSSVSRSEALEFAFGLGDGSIEVAGVSSEYWSQGILFAFSDGADSLVMIDPADGSAVTYSTGVNALDLEGIVFVPARRDMALLVPGSCFD